MVEDESTAAKERGPCLIVVSGRHDETIGARLALTPGEKVVVGRKTAIFDGETLGDSRISSRHCELVLAEDGLAISDLRSKNGLFFDGRRLQRARLADGQCVQIGSTFLCFRQRAPLVRARPSLLIGEGSAIANTRAQTQRLCKTGRPISIAGPAGSEKELVAREAHRLSGRQGEMVVWDLAAGSAASQQEEMSARAGAWERAKQGTLYVDGLERLSRPLQATLRARLARPEPADPLVLVAVAPALRTRVDPAALDSDLFGLLQVAQVEIPSLRDRREDFGALINYCLERSGYGHLGVSSTLMWALLRNPWPDELEGLERLLNNQAVSAPRGSEYLDLNPSTEAFLEHQLRAWAPRAQDDSTVDIVATP